MFLVSKNACPLREVSDGPDGPKFDVRARGFPLALPPPRRRAGVLPLPVLASLRSGWSSPSRWAGSGCVSVKGALRPSSQSSPCSPCGLCVAPGLLRAALDPAPSLKTRLRASQSLVDTFKRPSGATGHRIALGGPLRPPDGHSGPAWSSPAPQAWFRGSAPAPQPVRL